MSEKWHIKEASKQSKLSEDTIRFYEKEGLIKPGRGENGYRQYTLKEIKELKYIAVMKYARFSVKEMRSIMKLMNSPLSQECNENGQALLDKKVTDLKQTMRHYQQIIKLLQDLPLPNSFQEYFVNREIIGSFMDRFIEKIFNSIHEESIDENY